MEGGEVGDHKDRYGIGTARCAAVVREKARLVCLDRVLRDAHRDLIEAFRRACFCHWRFPHEDEIYRYSWLCLHVLCVDHSCPHNPAGPRANRHETNVYSLMRCPPLSSSEQLLLKSAGASILQFHIPG